MSKRAKVPVNCFFQGCYNPEYEREISKCKDKCFKYNQLNPNDRENQRKLLAEILGKAGKNAIITPPFWCDYGYNIVVGDDFYSNHNLIITDGAAVTFGDNVLSRLTAVLLRRSTRLTPNCAKRGWRSPSRST